jgi:hypothetical protein
MSQATIESPRFKLVFTWGGVVIALLGFVFLAKGDSPIGLLLLAAGMIAWLFAKRRSRAAKGSQS